MFNNELKIMVPNGWGVNEEAMPDDSRMLVIKPNSVAVENAPATKREGIFKKVPASELSLEDDFLKHVPRSEEEKRFKREIKKVIKAGMHDFWRPICDPSFDENGCICYEPGKETADGKDYNWWEKKAKEFCPDRGSRLGTKSEYLAFVAVLIKELVEDGMPLHKAWDNVCNTDVDDCIFSNDRNKVCGWYDFNCTYKYLANEGEKRGVWLVGGNWCDFFEGGRLTDLCYYKSSYICYEADFSTGWIVFDSCPDF